MNKDIISKKYIYFVDNIDVSSAEELSLKYPNLVFFTNTNEIVKNGLIYSTIKGIDPNYNKLTIGKDTFKLVIDNQLLKYIKINNWYWYIGCDEQFSISTIEPNNSNKTGWRFITNREDIIDNNETSDFFNENPIWPISDYISINLNESEKLNPNLYLYLPDKLIDKNIYDVGIYDVFGLTNFLESGGILEKISNIEIDNINYIIYKFKIKPKDSFSLKIYKNKL